MKIKTVLISGNFNILHPGHLRLIKFAREYGQHLIVGVLSDRIGGESVHISESLRKESIQSIGIVDEVLIIDEEITDFIIRMKPDVVIKGKEYKDKFNKELFAVEQYGGKLLFSSGEANFSSYDLINKELNSAKRRIVKFPDDYCHRHNIDKTKISRLLKNFNKLRVCVVGDLIVDEYINCQPIGMSQEDPVIVVSPVNQALFIGGAGIVAAHAAGLGANVKLFSIIGNDPAAKFAKDAFLEYKVNAFLWVDEARPTTLKQRYRSKGKTLFRVSHLHQGEVSLDLQKKILISIKAIIKDTDLLVFSDFNYGCLPQTLVDEIIQSANSNGVLMAADSQSSSQIGDIGRFRGMNLLTPTEREARIGTRNREDGLVVLAEELRILSGAHHILLKLAEDGLLIHSGDVGSDAWLTDRIDALNETPKDVAGAGDSLLIASAMCLASGGSIWDAACIGSMAAAVQVGRVGNIPLNINELMMELDP